MGSNFKRKKTEISQVGESVPTKEYRTIRSPEAREFQQILYDQICMEKDNLSMLRLKYNIQCDTIPSTNQPKKWHAFLELTPLWMVEIQH